MDLKWWFTLVFVSGGLLFLTDTRLSVTGVLYRLYRGVDQSGACSLVSENIPSLSKCVVLCQRHGGCEAGSYHILRKTCCVGSPAFDENAKYVEDNNSWFFREMKDKIYYDGWALAFRAIGGTGLSVYNAWANASRHDDDPVLNNDLQFGCLTLDGSWPCSAHFRSIYLDTWGSLGVQKVSLRLYKNGTRVVDVVFDGTGSNVMSWMTPSRILQSPWTDLSTSPSAYNYFGVNGYPVHRRYFFINKQYFGCASDMGWLCALDPLDGSREPCEWEQHPLPAFFYSTASNCTLWQGTDATVGLADVLAVFIQF